MYHKLTHILTFINDNEKILNLVRILTEEIVFTPNPNIKYV